jgi:predicted Zn-dependent peptidase
MEIVASELRDVAAGALRPGELDRAKENVKGRLLLSLESTSTRMTRLGKAVATGVDIVSVEETIERVESVTADDVVALAAELFAPEGLSAGGIGPSEGRFREAIERVNPGALAQAA